MNNKGFQHFLITSFNVDLNLKPREQILELEYLTKRFQIFEKICYPSVLLQTNQSFQWLCFFDRETPRIIQEKIARLAQWHNFVPIYTDPVTEDCHIFSETIQSYLVADTKFVITTNLDNDDAIGKYFIQTIQNNFYGQEFEFINFPFGYMLRKDGLFLREFLSSPFLSLVEKAKYPVTCKIIEHQKILKISKQGVPLRQVITQPIWLQLVHDSNLVNNLDVNSVIQNPKRLKNNFIIRDFVEEYLQFSYDKSLKYFWKNFILNNRYNITLSKKIRNILTLFNPYFAFIYLSWSSKIRNTFAKKIKLSSDRAKLICEQHEKKPLSKYI